MACDQSRLGQLSACAGPWQREVVQPLRQLRMTVGADGTTREGPGAPNAAVCLASDQGRFFKVLMGRLLK